MATRNCGPSTLCQTGRPQSPAPGDCCGSGCNPCVLDIHEQELRLWESSLNQARTGPALATNSYVDCVVSGMERISTDVIIFSISFSDTNLRCDLVPGSHIILQASSIDNERSIARQFTPVSPLVSFGSLDLLIKIYSDGRMGSLVRDWDIGSLVRIRGPFGSLDYKPNQYSHLSMLACGTGIAPMYQLIRHVLENENDETRIVLLYAVRTAKDILMKRQLDEFSLFWNMKIVYFLSREPDNDKRAFPLKYNDSVIYQRINEDFIRKELMPASPTHKVLICGTQPFNQSMKHILCHKLEFDADYLKLF